MPSFCAYYNQASCRSCGWLEVPYDQQLRRKEELVRAALAFLPSFELEESVGSPLQGFRNRAKMSVTGTVERPVIGLLGQERLDEGRELLSCPIHHPRLNELMSWLPEIIRDQKLIPYRIAERKGELKGLIAYYSPGSEQMYLRFVLRSRECVARIRKALPRLQEKFPSLVCVSANIQPVPHAILEGKEEIVLTERAFIEHRVGELNLKLAPQAFVQTNAVVAEKLYQVAAEWVGMARPHRMLELYCGQGAFSFLSAPSASRIQGIEINLEAVRTANQTARDLGLAHLEFGASDATRVGAEIREFGPDLILANPPRRGLSEGVQLIREHLPQHFIYSSCSIESLASDLRQLASFYRLERIRVFDLFPHTEHFETLVWLQRA